MLRTRSHGDVRRGDGLRNLHHSKNQLKKLDPKSRMPQKWQLNLKLRRPLRDTILKMEIPMRRAYSIALEDRNAPTQSLWEITMSGGAIMRKSPLIMWNQESHIIERPPLSTHILPQKLLAQWIRIQTKVHGRVPEALRLGQMKSCN